MFIGPLIALSLATAAPHAVPFTTVARGDGQASSYRTPTSLVVRDARRWRTVWRKLEPGKAPKVDFKRHMLLVVVQGMQRSGGYAIEVKRVTDSGRTLTIAADELAPGRGCITPTVITAPYHVVRVRKADRRTRVKRTAHTSDCETS